MTPEELAKNGLFRIWFEDKTPTLADFYLDFSEIQSKHYDDYMEKRPNKESDTGLKGQSNLMEWGKAFQKLFNQEKSSINVLENKGKLAKAYKVILTLKERSWYEELCSLYREKNISKTPNIGLTFDRKTIQLQEQFKWLAAAVANCRLNSGQNMGVHEFPPYKSSSRSRRIAEKLDSSNNSFARGYSQTESDVYPFDIQSPNKTQAPINSIQKINPYSTVN
jgi:hypothetical protein